MMNYAALLAFSNDIAFNHNVKFRDADGKMLKRTNRNGMLESPLAMILSQPNQTALTIDVCFTGSDRHLGNVIVTKIDNETAQIESYHSRFAKLIPESEKAHAIAIG